MNDKLQDVAEIVSGLLLELSTEVDTHYDDEDFFALEPTMVPIRAAIAYLDANALPVPHAATHVLNRFNRSRN